MLKEFEYIIETLKNNDIVLQMNNYKQHFDTTCYEHSYNVALLSYSICKKLNLDYVSATRAGMLHDLFLYDWRKRQKGRKGLHGFTHPKTSLQNASKNFNLNDKEKDIIIKHMWPLTLKFPKYKESFIVSLADKLCTYNETIEYYKNTGKHKLVYRFATILIIFCLIRTT